MTVFWALRVTVDMPVILDAFHGLPHGQSMRLKGATVVDPYEPFRGPSPGPRPLRKNGTKSHGKPAALSDDSECPLVGSALHQSPPFPATAPSSGCVPFKKKWEELSPG